jgi:hypothetical protein
MISFSSQSKIQTPQEKNIEAIAFGLIAVIKIGKGIQKRKKMLVVQGCLLLVIFGGAVSGRR